MSEYVGYVGTIQELIDRMEDERFRVGYCPSPNGYDEVEYIERLAASRFNVTLAIDEVDRWYPFPNSPLGDGLVSICKYGRHYGQGLVTTVRRPAAISRHMTSEGALWVFPMRDDRDRAYAIRNTGIDPGGISVLQTTLQGKTLVTEVIRHEYRTQILRFNLVTGDLLESETVYRPLPPPSAEESEEGNEETAEPETPSGATDAPTEAA